MDDPTGIQQRYRQFAETECKGYSDLYYRLALSVSLDDEVAAFIGQRRSELLALAHPNGAELTWL
jgi:hypothetical protein